MGTIRVDVSGSFMSNLTSEAVIPDELATRLAKRTAEGKDWTVASAVADMIESYEEPGPWPIRYGERALQVVLTFTSGQTVVFPLKIKDTSGIGGVELQDITVEKIRVLVRAQDEAERKCRANGHSVGNLKTVGAPLSGHLHHDHRVRGHCGYCGDAVWFWDERGRTDVDVMIAEEVARRVAAEPAVLTEDLAAVDVMRRRLEARRAELDEALEILRVVQMVLAERLESELRPDR